MCHSSNTTSKMKNIHYKHGFVHKVYNDVYHKYTNNDSCKQSIGYCMYCEWNLDLQSITEIYRDL